MTLSLGPGLRLLHRLFSGEHRPELASPEKRCFLLFGRPGFRLGARWNRLGEAVKTRKKREKTGQKWARYGLRRVNKEGTGGITWADVLSRALADRLSHRYTLLKYLALAYAQRFTSNWIQAQMDNLTSGGASLGDTIM